MSLENCKNYFLKLSSSLVGKPLNTISCMISICSNCIEYMTLYDMGISFIQTIFECFLELKLISRVTKS